MSFELHQRKHIEDELTKIVRQQLRNTAHALTTSAGSQFRSAVHESRKSVKKVRAVAAFLKQAGAKLPRRDRRRLKSAARALSRVRDSTAIIDTFDRVRRRYPKQLPEHTYGILRRGLVAARDRSEARAQRDGVVAEAAKRLEKTRKSAKQWTSPPIKWPGMIAIVTASYRRSRNAMKRARVTGQSATLHRWRKRRLNEKAAKTVNNTLTVLNVLLKTAVAWDVIERHPCSILLLPVPLTSAQFHDFDAYDRLVQAADRLGLDTYLIVLLGGDAGLRLGEVMALERGDVDLQKRQLCVRNSDWKGHVTMTKGGRLRHVPMTERLAAALKAHRHLRGKRELVQSNGEPLTMKIVQDRVARAAQSAGVRSGVHILRHTFCSHLAMRGAPARAIQELAGHQDLKTTQRYMHLSPAAIEGAIRLLDATRTGTPFGNMLATGSTESANVTR